MTSTRPRWVLVTTDFPDAGGGIARLLGAIVDYSSEQVDWRISTTSPGTGSATIRRARGRTGLIAGLRKDLAWAADGPAGRVICGHAYLSAPVLAAAKAQRLPAAALVYGREIEAVRPVHHVLLAGLRGYRRIVSISDSTTRRLASLGVKDSQVTTVLPDIIKPALAEVKAPRDATGGLRLVMVSRLAERYKNVDVILAAISLLRDTQAIEGCTIVGDGAARAGYIREVERLGLSDCVSLPGYLTDADVAAVYRGADVGLFPSRDSSAEVGFEGFGLVIHEMAAAGLPVLVGDAAGAREAARPGWTISLNPEDAGAWAVAMHQLHRDNARLTDMIYAARAFAEDMDPALAVAATVKALGS